MSDKHDSTTLTRRGFLRSAAAVGGAAAAAALSQGAMAETSAEPEVENQPKPQGYRPTAHVLTYYEKARF